ncbi:conserved hypothetical protein [Ricinus communis]|uniref:Uncharacterized protein n=1 Tax=Ricinus communis TaxID=3988 RepID=B9SF89_RICCO|nr:conserved hypothetical protein [Ricinus communis]
MKYKCEGTSVRRPLSKDLVTKTTSSPHFIHDSWMCSSSSLNEGDIDAAPLQSLYN